MRVNLLVVQGKSIFRYNLICKYSSTRYKYSGRVTAKQRLDNLVNDKQEQSSGLRLVFQPTSAAIH